MTTRAAPRANGPTATRARRTAPVERRRQLLDVAEQLLESGGSDSLRMDSLAQAAGVSRPVVYDHFENRDGLIVALLERHDARIHGAEPTRSADDASFEERLTRSTMAYLATSTKHGPAMRALVSGEHLSPAVEVVRRRIWNAGVDKWARIYAGNFSLARPDAKALAISHLAGLSALSGECIAGRLSTRRATVLHVSSVLGALNSVARTTRGRS